MTEYAVIMDVFDEHHSTDFGKAMFERLARSQYERDCKRDGYTPVNDELRVEWIKASITEMTNPATGEVVQLPEWALRVSGEVTP
jgi:hypothetical protein